jgi:hypothetical protein
MKNKLKELFTNATRSIVTSLLGTIIGFPQLLEGLQNDDPHKIIVAVATILLGLFAKETHD